MTPRPVVELDELAPLPPFALYPLSQQIADKVCAMYQRYGLLGDQPSTRFHDLVDLVLIVDSWALDAEVTYTALIREVDRRALALPARMITPDPRWHVDYPRTARPVPALRDDAKTIAGALQIVGRCLDPLLARDYAPGTWDPHAARWRSSSTR